MESKPNRPSDAAPNNQIISEVTLPEGVSPDVFMKNVQAADKAYCDCINYDLFPEWTGNHNSNSYARGLLESVGGKADINWSEYKGGDTPVPPNFFRKQK
ncbi:MAG: hypothetical protein ABF335_11930 [Alphaproteobacteria bacterium]